MRDCMQQIVLITAIVSGYFIGTANPVLSAEVENQSEWRAAAISVVITPEKSMWMSGYAARNKPSEGKVHDLYAKVLIIEDVRGQKVVIVTTDLIGITPALRDPIAARLESEFKIPSTALLMNASHTHCGPELREEKASRRGLGGDRGAEAREYTQKLSKKIVGAIGQTLSKLEPVQLKYSYGRAGFSMNRRLPTAKGVSNSPHPQGPVDQRVPVLSVNRPDGSIVAALFGYACHNTTLSFYQFCGDYAGFAQEYLETDHPGMIALFMMGCGGDQNPYPRRTLDLAKQHGRALSNAVEVALSVRQPRLIHGPLGVAMDDVELEFTTPPSLEELLKKQKQGNKYEKSHATRLLAQVEERGGIQTRYAFPLQVIQFGNDLTLTAICGETVVDYSLRLQTELKINSGTEGKGEPIIWVAGYSNHVFGYLPSLRVLKEGGYEGGGAMTYTSYPGPFTDSVEKRVISKIKELTKQARKASQ
ncbi:MAG: neutral/alkaline non-lysosomal ceramidase N-terminal domain-containing protein [Planctomycetes bacterium]|nr:neutral/alkaline non-lysosomal ceramidase N-terminal domain-containing protein [Planctomycetota bacterium]MCH9726998.1 neutral/alkaline non-lysosomal ceramidase N-terminal domain-containing protein [Planctomycetota bacterium]MCH9775212.1 neutral/alkaline non-lysosomal ceramidase N-terminal domain-containing protein [Planctomycetota bacterium]MCH9789197.1 neutral/alkaline non-lysosomal ceramidase N-terminal domain-containing protein [Planctomycetota bacterium]